MSRRGTGLLKVALNAMHFTGADRLLAPLTRGVGVIFMLHRIVQQQTPGFRPNRILEVTPEFLEETIRLVVDRGFDVISLDEVHGRLRDGDFDRPFASFTFDDGYRDNRTLAYPIFRRYRLPFAIYVPTDFADGAGDLWWLKLEAALDAATAVELRIDGVPTRLETRTTEQKERTFDRLYWWLRSIPEDQARGIVQDLCEAQGVDMASLCRDLVMDWDEIRDLARDPLVTIGAHTRRHLALAKLTSSEARLDIVESVRRIEKELQTPVRHFSYPYGDEDAAGDREFELVRELGLLTAVTTRKGLLHSSHAAATTALPRVSLNGEFQSARYVKVLLSGAPFAFWDMARGIRPGSLAARLTSAPSRPVAAGTSSR